MTRLYKIYPASSYNNLDLTLFQENIRWNNDNTEFIVEFINPPHGNTTTLSHSEAVLLMEEDNWRLSIDGL